MLRLLLAVSLAASALYAGTVGVGSAQQPASGPIEPGYVPPLDGPLRVVRPFHPPVTPYGPGHRGVDLRAERNALVRSSGAGQVSFAGLVAGRVVVVVSHADGVRTEYEPLRPLVRAGARVRAGQPIGVVDGRHPSCPGWCLHWGARRGDSYLDPLTLLRPLGPVVLLPWDQGPARGIRDDRAVSSDGQARGWAR
jgi:murein DD-endopeptidase MepM/ murein hydrolase activator NlpD